MNKRIDKVRGYLVSTATAAGQWYAVFDEFYSPYNGADDIMGHGTTEAAAIVDLFELPWPKWWKENPPQSDLELDARLSAMRPIPRDWLKRGAS